MFRGCKRALSCLLLSGCFFACNRAPAPHLPDAGLPQAPPDAASADAAPLAEAAPWMRASPDVLIYSTDLAIRAGDKKSARQLLDLALQRLSVSLTVHLAAGLREPLSVPPLPAAAATTHDAETAPLVLRDIAASGVSAAIAHGHFLSVVELSGEHRTLRLAEHRDPILEVLISANGLRVATRDSRGVVRLYALPTGALLVETPLGIDPLRLRKPGSYLDFSPDSNRLLVSDCGAALFASQPSCSVRRLRVFNTMDGSLLGEVHGDSALLSTTSRSDGTLALLFAEQRPRFFDSSTVAEWPRNDAPIEPGPFVSRCLGAPKKSAVSQRSFAQSPERSLLGTLEPGSTLCLWDLMQHRLLRAIDLGHYGVGLRLQTLLAEGRGALITIGSELFLFDGRTGMRKQKLPFAATALPLDDGGALLLPTSFSAAATPSIYRISVAADKLQTSEQSLRGLKQSHDLDGLQYGTVSGNGRSIFYIEKLGRNAESGLPKQPRLLDLLAAPRLLPIPSQAFGGCCVQADFLDLDRRLVYVDSQANLRIHALPSGELLHSSPRLPAITALQLTDDGLNITLADGNDLRLLPKLGQLRRAAEDPAQKKVGSPPPSSPAAKSLPSGITARAMSPDQRQLLFGGAHGEILWLDAGSGALLLRMQIITADRPNPIGAIAISPSGRFEILGGIADVSPFLFCRAGPYAVPLDLCKEKLEQPGLIAATIGR